MNFSYAFRLEHLIEAQLPLTPVLIICGLELFLGGDSQLGRNYYLLQQLYDGDEVLDHDFSSRIGCIYLLFVEALLWYLIDLEQSLF